MAESATVALRAFLREGGVRIFNIGPDKMPPRRRRRHDAAKRKRLTTMLAAGHVRSYAGGHRSGWCANAGHPL